MARLCIHDIIIPLRVKTNNYDVSAEYFDFILYWILKIWKLFFYIQNGLMQNTVVSKISFIF